MTNKTTDFFYNYKEALKLIFIKSFDKSCGKVLKNQRETLKKQMYPYVSSKAGDKHYYQNPKQVITFYFN